MAGDGQVTLNNTVIKAGASKVKRAGKGKVLVGFAGGAADGFALFTRFERSWRSSRAISSARRSSWPRTGGPTGCCAGWRRC